MAKTPSFFDRLTGASTNQDDTAQSQNVEVKGDDTETAEVTTTNTDTQDAEKEQNSGEKREQWMEEAQEGQLTIDVYQTDTDIVIKSTVAGVKADELDIAITNDMVTIRGRRDPDEKVPDDQYFYKECYWGPFSRSVILPGDVASDQAEATMNDGVLTIRLPKVEKEQTKKIKVKSVSSSD